jgi:hypothetical protein
MKSKVIGIVVIAFLLVMAAGCLEEQTKNLTIEEQTKNLKIGEKYIFKNHSKNAEFVFEVKDVMFSTEYHSRNLLIERGDNSRIGYQFLWVQIKAVNTGDSVIELPHHNDIYAVADGEKYNERENLEPGIEYDIGARYISEYEVSGEGAILRQKESREGWFIGIQIPEKYDSLKIYVAPSKSKYYPSFSGQCAIWVVK